MSIEKKDRYVEFVRLLPEAQRNDLLASLLKKYWLRTIEHLETPMPHRNGWAIPHETSYTLLNQENNLRSLIEFVTGSAYPLMYKSKTGKEMQLFATHHDPIFYKDLTFLLQLPESMVLDDIRYGWSKEFGDHLKKTFPDLFMTPAWFQELNGRRSVCEDTHCRLPFYVDGQLLAIEISADWEAWLHFADETRAQYGLYV